MSWEEPVPALPLLISEHTEDETLMLRKTFVISRYNRHFLKHVLVKFSSDQRIPESDLACVLLFCWPRTLFKEALHSVNCV